LFQSIVSWFLYRPAPASSWAEPPATLRIRDVNLCSADGNRIHAWWSAPEGWTPEQGAVLFCHGNAGNLSHRGENLRRWQEQLGVAVLIFDYPGYGRSTGRPSEAGCYAAGDAAYDYLAREAGVPGERIILYGGSLGGAVAIHLAASRPRRALVLVSAFTSLADMVRQLYPWLPGRLLAGNLFANEQRLATVSGPVFLAHGTADRLVPFAQGERLFAAAREPKLFFPMKGYDHKHTPGRDFYATLRDFLMRTQHGSLTGAGERPA
jgi:fermentation-respiration switch protein FrsA (DUF1100 family)